MAPNGVIQHHLLFLEANGVYLHKETFGAVRLDPRMNPDLALNRSWSNYCKPLRRKGLCRGNCGRCIPILQEVVDQVDCNKAHDPIAVFVHNLVPIAHMIVERGEIPGKPLMGLSQGG